MLVESPAQKTRLVMMTAVATIADCAVICGFTIWCCISLVDKGRQQIYALDGDILFLAEHAQLEANFIMEAKAYIQLFHQYFFNLPLDNDYIEWMLGKAIYMVDGTTPKRKQALDKNGLYSDIISSSIVRTIMRDSILLDEYERKFTYYDTQLIKQHTRGLRRSMVTTDYIEDVPRTRNNPYRLMITSWRMIENKDLDY